MKLIDRGTVSDHRGYGETRAYDTYEVSTQEKRAMIKGAKKIYGDGYTLDDFFPSDKKHTWEVCVLVKEDYFGQD